MNIKQLQTFITVAECGDYRVGAKKQKISLRELHNQLFELRSEINHPLFDEIGIHEVQLTMYGKVFLNSAIRIVNEYNYLENMLSDIEKFDCCQTIRVVSTLPHKLNLLYNEFFKKHPSLKLEYIKDIQNPYISLEKRDYDILETELTEDEFPPTLTAFPLNTDHLQVYVAYINPLFANKEVTIEELKEYTIYLPESRSKSIDSLYSYLIQNNYSIYRIPTDDYSIFKSCDKNSVYIQEPIGIYSYTSIKSIPLIDSLFDYTYGLLCSKECSKAVSELIESISENKNAID